MPVRRPPEVRLKELLSGCEDLLGCLPEEVRPAFTDKLSGWQESIVEYVEGEPIRQGTLLQHQWAFRNELRRIKNQLHALGSLDNAVEMLDLYFDRCLESGEQFVKRVSKEEESKEKTVTAWGNLKLDKKMQLVNEVRDEVLARAGVSLPQPPQQRRARRHYSNQAVPSSVATAPQYQPEHHQSASPYQLQQGRPQPVAPAPRVYPTAMPQSVNPGYGSQRFQNYATAPGNPAGYDYNGSSSGVNLSASFASAFSTGQQYQPPPSTRFQHLSNAHTTPASSAAASPYSFPNAELQQLLYGDLPLVQACQRLIYAADTAGITKPEEKEWFEKIRAAERHVPQAERWRLVDFLKVGTSTIHRIVDDCINGCVRTELVHALAQDAMKRCSEEIERLAHFHAGETGQTLRSLGSSSHTSRAFHRLSHRQRVIYGRTFSSSAY